MIKTMAQQQNCNTDDFNLNGFHKEWNEHCVKGDKRTASIHFSPKIARTQSAHIKEQNVF